MNAPGPDDHDRGPDGDPADRDGVGGGGGVAPLAVGDATDTLFGSIALATAGGTIFGTIGAMWVLPLMLMPLRRPKFRFRLPKFRWPKLRLRFWRTAS